jgi:thiamine biosynthesis lipoprotein
MKTKGLIIQLAVLFAVLAAIYLVTHETGRRSGPYIKLAGTAQGTSYHITYESVTGENYKHAIDSLLADFDQSLSIYQPNSIISRFNRNDPDARADEKFKTVFRKSEEVNRKTDGAFDITVAPIVNALGFGNSDTLKVDSTVIDSLRAYVGMGRVKLQNDQLIKDDPNVKLDVNAIAQGFSVDLVAEFLQKNKIKNYLVEIGGEVRTRGKNEKGMTWRIGIDRPFEGNMLPGENLQAIVRLSNRSLATSGNYRRYYERDGVKYVHTINPKTGYPVVSNLLSATVVADDCITADAYATAFMVFGVERSKAFLSENSFLDALLIYSDEKGSFHVYSSPGLKKFIDE